MSYTNSPLVVYTKLSPNDSGQRTHAIDRITPHCVVGQLTVESLGNVLQNHHTKHHLITGLAQMEKSLFMLKKETALGVLLQIQTISVQLLSNVLLMINTHIQ